MRSIALISAAALAASLAVASCGATASPTPPPDGQTVLTAASKATYPTKLEFTLGGSLTASGTTMTLPDKALVIDVDTAAGVGLVHVALPASLLGASGAGMLAQLGVTGDTLTLDALYDGKALYAKSPALPALVSQLALFAQGVTLPQLGPDTWAKVLDEATIGQIATMAKGAVASAAPSAAASPSVGDLKAVLDQMGGTVTLDTQATGAGGPAYDVKFSLDPVKLKAYINAHPEQFPSSQASTIEALGQLTSMSADVLVDTATSRIEQFSVAVAGTQNGSAVNFTLKVGIAEAPASVSFAAPSGAVDLPLVKILTPLIQSMMGSGGGLLPSAAP